MKGFQSLVPGVGKQKYFRGNIGTVSFRRDQSKKELRRMFS